MTEFYIQSAAKIKPGGWLRKQMLNDLENGFVGHLDEMLPVLFEKDDIYGKDRRGRDIKKLDLGLAAEEDLDPLHLQWWNSETQSQWYDGLIRNAFMLENETYIKKCCVYVQRMLSCADEDGYMGIYQKDARYNFENESGELWAQATLFRALLGYYQMTGDDKVLEAVVKAVDVTMENYKDNGPRKNIFNTEQTHGVMFSDVLHYLYYTAEDKKYARYMEFLYGEVSASEINMGFDIQEKNILDREYRFRCHGVHTYEHLRALTSLARLSDNPYYSTLLDQYLKKLETCICPSGGGIGDEWIFGRSADPTKTGYEYCSLQELLHSYSFLLEGTGDLGYGNKIENLFLNAAQGMRHPHESSIAYLIKDNSYSMLGNETTENKNIPYTPNVRYKYSPTHQDAAVCCVPNAARIAPYYLQTFWLGSENGLLKVLYGESSFKTTIDGVEIRIEEKTAFPLNGRIEFNLFLSQPKEVPITFRIPDWCKKYRVDCNKKYTATHDAIVFNDQWDCENKIMIDFHFEFSMHFDLLYDVYFKYGPLLLALPLEAQEKAGREYGICGLREVYYSLNQDFPAGLHADEKTIDSFELLGEAECWKDMRFSAVLKDGETEKRLVFAPMAGTILRKVTFPFRKEDV